MKWDTSPELMAKVLSSVSPVRTEAALCTVLAQDFPRDCSDLPISGGWGYTQAKAIKFIPNVSPIPIDFVSLEYHIAQKIIYEELIIFRPKDYRFSGITMNRTRQHVISGGDRKYDHLEFQISCWSDWHWEQLKNEWEENDFGMRPGFDSEAHAAKRMASETKYERDLWFDVTDVMRK